MAVSLLESVATAAIVWSSSLSTEINASTSGVPRCTSSIARAALLSAHSISLNDRSASRISVAPPYSPAIICHSIRHANYRSQSTDSNLQCNENNLYVFTGRNGLSNLTVVVCYCSIIIYISIVFMLYCVRCIML